MSNREKARIALQAFLNELPQWFDQIELLKAADTPDGVCFELSRHVGGANVYTACLFGKGYADIAIDREPHRFALRPYEIEAIVRTLRANGYLCGGRA